MKLQLVIGWMVLLIGIALSQLSPEWENHVNGFVYDEHIRQLAVSPTGNAIVCGYEYETTLRDIKVAQFTPQGAIAWEYVYNDPLVNGTDVARAVVVDPSGNVWVGGFSATVNGSGWTVIKLDSSGNFLWKHTPGDWMRDVFDLALAPSGYGYALGHSIHSGTSGDISLVKYSPDGVVQWITHFNGPDNLLDIPYRLALDDSENVLIAGYTTGDTTNRNFTVIKCDSSGTIRWVHYYNGSADLSDEATDVAVDAAGNVYATGFATETGTNFDITTLKLNRHGVVQWISSYNQAGDGSEFAHRIAVHDSNQIYVAGTSLSKMILMKYNATGDTLWTRLYWNYPVSNTINDMVLDSLGNIYVSGWTKDPNLYANQITALKYLPDGTLAWDAIYSVPNTARNDGYGIALDSQGNVLVSGECFNGSEHYLVVLKLPATATGVSSQPVSRPETIQLLGNYPNPFNSYTVVTFRNPVAARVRLDIYDPTGRKVRTLVHQRFSPGEHRIIWDGTDRSGRVLSSGIYFYLLQSNQFTQTGKMLLVK